MVYAQDPQFSQVYSSPLNLSPSFAGNTNGIRTILNYRIQWYSAYNYGYNTASLSADYNFKIFNSGLGLVLLSDFAGAGMLNREKVGLDYNYNVKLFRGVYFKPGVEFSATYIGLSDNFNFGSELRENNPTNDDIVEGGLDSKIYFDAAASILLFTRKYMFGATLSHLLQPNESLTGVSEKVPMKFVAFAGGKYDLNGRLGRDDEESISYNIIYRAQDKFDQIDIGAYWYKRSIKIGLWYRGIPGLKQNEDNSVNQDAISLMLQYETKKWGVGYSYDITISRLYSDTGGAHEISLFYVFLEDKELKKRQKQIKVPCPRF